MFYKRVFVLAKPKREFAKLISRTQKKVNNGKRDIGDSFRL